MGEKLKHSTGKFVSLMKVFPFAAVKSIKKQHLVEVRSMGNPPPAVKLALESICLLLGEQAADWRTIRGVIIKDNFISTIVNFSTEDISYVTVS